MLIIKKKEPTLSCSLVNAVRNVRVND